MAGDVQSMNDAILKVEHVSMKFGGLVAIGDLSFEAKRGDITALIGPNGAGKTTVFNCITGFYKPTEGMITLNRQNGEQLLLERMPDFRITAKAKVARTFQNIRLFSGMTVLENLLVAQHNKLMVASGFTVLGLLGLGTYRRASDESMEQAKFWLDKTHLTDRADDPAGDLPYGAQRRLEIARAMCTGPELLCLDEPAAGLNPRESLALNELLNDIKESTGTSILLIEHDMSVVMQISDHVVVLEYGRKISDGDPLSVRSDPRVIAAYLGVEDEEVTEVLVEVGDEQVIEELDAEPDPAHGPSASASMFAGPVVDTIAHSDDMGERVTVSRAASKASQVDEREAREKSRTSTKAASSAKAPASKAARPKSDTKAASGAAAAKSSPAGTAAKSSGGTASGKAKPAKAVSLMSSAQPSPKPAASKPAATSKAGGIAKAKTEPAKAKPLALSNTLKAPRGGKSDRLILIKGIGPVNEKKLNEHGIFHFDQIAAWTKSDIAAAEFYLAFDGRIEREEWIKQAKALAKQAASAGAKGKSATEAGQPSGKRGGRK